jgi:hypothetical protein
MDDPNAERRGSASFVPPGKTSFGAVGESTSCRTGIATRCAPSPTNPPRHVRNIVRDDPPNARVLVGDGHFEGDGLTTENGVDVASELSIGRASERVRPRPKIDVACHWHGVAPKAASHWLGSGSVPLVPASARMAW